MKKIYTTAQGKQVDIDGLRIANEQTIAVGNMKVNARGDELGPGGTVAQTRNQSMDSYYKLNTPMPSDHAVADTVIKQNRDAGVSMGKSVVPVEAPVEFPEEQQVQEEVQAQADPEPAPEVPQTTMRGSLAASVGKPAAVTQELITPPNKRTGVTRI